MSVVGKGQLLSGWGCDTLIHLPCLEALIADQGAAAAAATVGCNHRWTGDIALALARRSCEKRADLSLLDAERLRVEVDLIGTLCIVAVEQQSTAYLSEALALGHETLAALHRAHTCANRPSLPHRPNRTLSATSRGQAASAAAAHAAEGVARGGAPRLRAQHGDGTHLRMPRQATLREHLGPPDPPSVWPFDYAVLRLDGFGLGHG